MDPTRRRVLCAEAHDDTCSMLSHLLEQSNYEVVGAKTIGDALSLAQRQHFNLYLLSGVLEDGTGVELCEQIRSFDQNTPILFYSAYARESDRKQAISAGAQDYLVKPGDIFELTGTITRLVDQAASAAQTGLPSNLKLAGNVERRSKPRIYQTFHARVYGSNACGKEFEAKAVLGNISASGLYLRLPQHVEQGAKLGIVVRPATANDAPAPWVAVNGVVLRAEPQPDGVCGLGISLHNTDFIEEWSWALRR